MSSIATSDICDAKLKAKKERGARAKAQAKKNHTAAEKMRQRIREYLALERMSLKDFNVTIKCSPTTMSRFLSGQMSVGSLAYHKSRKYFSGRPRVAG